MIDQQALWPTMLLLETGEADIGTVTLERTSAEDPLEMRGELEGWLVADYGFEPTTTSVQGALQFERPRLDGLEADIAWVVVGEGLSSSSGALVNVTFADLGGLTVSRWSILVGLLGVLLCLAALLTYRVRALHDSPPPPMLSGSH